MNQSGSNRNGLQENIGVKLLPNKHCTYRATVPQVLRQFERITNEVASIKQKTA